jgi:hypothetical protein
MHGKRGHHPYAFWLTVFCFVGGILNTTLTSVYFTHYQVPLLGTRSKASLDWVFGVVPDTPHTFNAALSSAVLGMALIMCLFRVWIYGSSWRGSSSLFGMLSCYLARGADRSVKDVLRLEWIMMMVVGHNLLWFALRASMLLPQNAGVMASVRESFSYVMVNNLYLSISDPDDRVVFAMSLCNIIVLVTGLVDRFIMVFDKNQPAFGVFIAPVVSYDNVHREDTTRDTLPTACTLS